MQGILVDADVHPPECTSASTRMPCMVTAVALVNEATVAASLMYGHSQQSQFLCFDCSTLDHVDRFVALLSEASAAGACSRDWSWPNCSLSQANGT